MNKNITVTVINDQAHDKYGAMVEGAATVDEVRQALQALRDDQKAELAALPRRSVIIGGPRSAKQELIALAQEVKASLQLAFVPVRYTDFRGPVDIGGVSFR